MRCCDDNLDVGLEASLDFSRPGFRLRLDLCVPPTGVTALIGPSGCGKSTLLRLLAGLEIHAAGHIRHGDRTWLDRAHRIDLAPRHRRVGLLFQEYALFPHLSVAGNIAYGLPRGRDREAAVAFWLARLQLDGLAARRPETLSGGQRQRVALARALASEPAVLLLDEPFSAVDCSLRQSLRLLFQEVLADRSVPTILVTHDLEDVRLIADRVGVLIDGELRQIGPTHEIFARPIDAETARVLGWHNLLSVSSWDRQTAHGAWGALRLGPHEPSRRADAIAILPDGPRLNAERGLPVEVARVSDMGGYQALFCRLTDRSLLRIHLAQAAQCPEPGTQTRLDVPEDTIISLPTRWHGPICVDPIGSLPLRGCMHHPLDTAVHF
ncbi:ABC transporter ATP-binding protein [Thiocystis violascens]|uniref:ABC-type spermidine/putrescine transport system, ATPase component n=1 Tax=Thiocystis violascens (strain ATCC 17096 / DSM 198 / 6111) TaxID=765911 RepID=I3YEA3_THIV6|nr:ABC transporter ATP-binding protein [Thiocystis violascens]AFL75321.1 ABC-type spermidine/putrescine transport system, ATPase component [Thiocystis violascens DSM 198]